MVEASWKQQQWQEKQACPQHHQLFLLRGSFGQAAEVETDVEQRAQVELLLLLWLLTHGLDELGEAEVVIDGARLQDPHSLF